VSVVEVRDAEGDWFEVKGPLQFATVPAVWRSSLCVFTGRHRRLVFDLAGVTRSDSAGLALLVEWMREARKKDIEVHFTNIPAQMEAIARASNLRELLP